MQAENAALDSVPYPAIVSDDPETILRFAASAIEGGSCALATLVEIRGGAARALGAQMAIRDDGAFCGFVSGGCTESAVAAEALTVIRTGFDRYLRLGQGSQFFDIELPCGGGLTVQIHRLHEAGAVNEVLFQLGQRKRIALAYDPGTQQIKIRSDKGEARWQDGLFIRPYRPRPRILISGNSIETATLQKMADAAGYETLPWDPAIPMDADTAVALLHHDLDRELDILPLALAGEAFYIGALGSSTTHRRRCDALRQRGFAEGVIARIKAPIGIIPKARDSITLALSVIGDIAAAYGASSGTTTVRTSLIS